MREKLELRISEHLIKISANKIAGTRIKENVSRAARIFRNGKLGTAVARGVTDFPSLIKRAEENMDYGLRYEYELPANNTYFKDFAEGYENLSLKELNDICENVLNELTQKYPDYLFNGIAVTNLESKLLENDLNLSLYENHQMFYFVLFFKEKGGSNIMDGYIDYSSGSDIKLNQFLKHIEDLFSVYKSKQNLKSGVYPVILVDDGMQKMLLDFFMQSLDGKRYFEKTSMLSGKIGEQVFNKSLSIVDSNLMPEYGIVNPFDMEGMIRDENDLDVISCGVVKNVALDLATAARFKKKSTANGYRTYMENPKIEFSHINIKPNDKRLKEILGGNEAIIPVVASGGAYTDKGDFATPVQLAFLYKNGMISGRLPQIQISGNFFKMFNEDFLGCSSEKMIPYYPSNPFVIKMNIDTLN
ncbi:MAG: hypothetical protein JXA60_03105 [Candidatus Coatesbacteria bacterium]|nr:hypothetical protein [Candidatus Coatesbacteria bacterium]